MTTLSSLTTDKICEPLVTIAIPTFNRAELLQGCIAAAFDQSYRHFEVLVSDNASTDETPEILKRYSDPRLRVLRQQRNLGLLPNFNALLEQARGEFIIFVPDDDRIVPSMLERCIVLVKSAPQIPVVVTQCDVYFAADGRTWRVPGNRRLGTGIWDGAEILHEFLKDKISTSMCGIMFRTERLRAKGGVPVQLPYAADIASWAPLLLEGKAGLVNEACASLAMHSESQTTAFAIDVRVDDGHKIVDLIAEAADKHVENPQQRRTIKIESQRHFARRTVKMLASYRRQGAGFREVLPLMWRFRRDFMRVGMRDIGQIARSFVILVLPAPIARWVRHIVRSPQNLKMGAVE